MTDLTARLEMLEAKQAIFETLHLYVQSHSGPLDDYLACFTDDAVLDHVGRDRVHGLDEIRARFEHTRTAMTTPHKLVLLAPLVSVDGERATLRAEYVYIVLGDDAPSVHAFGRCEAELRRDADSIWRFCEKRIFNESGLRPAWADGS